MDKRIIIIFSIVGVVLLIFVEQSQQCQGLWSNQCRSNGDCCSGNCYKEGHWDTGVCKPGNGGGGNPQPPPSGGISVTHQEFNNAVTQAGFETPSYDKYVAFQNGIAKGQIATKREAAMALAQFLHESGGLRYKREIICEQDGCPHSYRQSWCDAPGQYYYGRGYIQLTWCGNYREAGQDLGLGDQLVQNPDRVANEEQLAWDTAFSFWKRKVRTGKYGSQVQQGMFGASTRAINGDDGGIECQGNGAYENQSRKRFQYYTAAFRAFGIQGQPDERGCNY